MSREDPRVRRTRADVRRVAGQLLAERGWDHVTHANVARAAGYSKATLYKHWPNTSHLLLIAFQEVVHFTPTTPTGHLRADLIAELETFRAVLTDDGLGNWLAAMADRASAVPAISELRDALLEGGQAHLRALIAHGIRSGELRDVADLGPVADMLTGAVAYRIAVCGHTVDDDYIPAVVDTFLTGMSTH